MGTNPVVKVQQLFFDRDKVDKYVSRKKKRAFTKSGAYVRRTAQFSMRSRKGSAPAGQPPFAHAKGLKRHLYFYYDPDKETVIVGPVLFSETASEGIPRLMERGGVVSREVRVPTGNVTSVDGTMLKKFRTERRDLSYDPHPYMLPALAKNKGKIAEFMAE